MSDVPEPMPKSDDDAQKQRRNPRLGMLSQWDSLMDQIFDEAQAAGIFDNLPGQGKPLKLEDNPYAGDKQLTYKLLKDNNFTLPWISDRNEIMADIDRFRSGLAEGWRRFLVEWRGGRATGQAPIQRKRWQLQIEIWEGDVQALNKRLLALNLQLPVKQLEVLPLDLDTELARVGAGRELP